MVFVGVCVVGSTTPLLSSPHPVAGSEMYAMIISINQMYPVAHQSPSSRVHCERVYMFMRSPQLLGPCDARAPDAAVSCRISSVRPPPACVPYVRLSLRRPRLALCTNAQRTRAGFQASSPGHRVAIYSVATECVRSAQRTNNRAIICQPHLYIVIRLRLNI